MQKILFALSLGFGCIIFALQSAHAQQQANCGQRGQVVERLQTKYGESRRSVGLAANNGVVEMYASNESGTWTIVITMPNGMTCLVAAGDAFQPVDEAAVKRGDKV